MNEYKNESAGKECGGICDYCKQKSLFLYHNWGTMCQECANNCDPKKYRVVKNNLLMTDYCLVCNKREKVMIQINYGFCHDCFKKIGKKERLTSKVQNDKTVNNLKKFNKKIGFKIINEEEVKEYEWSKGIKE